MPVRPPFVLAALLLVLGLTHAAPSAAGPIDTRLLRFPDVHGDLVVFCYAGDLWAVSIAGGIATRLTAHPGLELFPKFSPDGKQVAFTGQYDGDEQVYVIPTTGGTPRQLTYYPARGPLPPRWGYDNQVYGWTVDGSAVLFRSMQEGWSLTDTRLYTAPLAGGLPRALKMPVSGAGDFSPDGRSVVYSPLVRDFRTWKRYEGGWAQDLYVFDLASGDQRRITDDKRSDRDPMWIGDRIWFSSDRSGTLNLYEFDTTAGTTRQVTKSTTADLRWPSSDGRSRIVYELDGRLELLDVETGSIRPLAIRVPNDGVAMRPSRVRADGLIEDFELSPKGERALFVARGDLFTVPVEKGPTRNLTQSPGAHDKWARWSPDGRQVAFVSDRTGEEEIWLVDQDGKGQPQQLTDDGRAMRYAPEWAPDGKRLAFSDKNGQLSIIEIDSKKKSLIADEARGEVRDYVWSPDGAHVAFSLSDPNGFRSIYIWSVGEPEARRVTDWLFDEHTPAWDPEGRFLYYLSEREFAPQLARLEWNYAADRMTAVYAMVLQRDGTHPFPPESDEVTIEAVDAEAKKPQSDATDETKNDSPANPVRIDFDGLAGRVARVPIAPDNYDALFAMKDQLVVLRRGANFYGRDGAREPELRLFVFKGREDKLLTADVSGFALSRDGSKVVVRQSGSYKVYDVKPEAKEPKVIATAGISCDRVPAEEWAQIFDEVWRRFRDFFYVENMHGYDWKAIRDRYRPLLAHVAHRSDLNYVIGEMIAELNVGHAYIQGGEWETPERVAVALPGARFELDPKAERYRIARVLRGQNEEDRYRAPLTEVGVDAREGDYVLAIDGVELRGEDNPYRLLRNRADRPVELTLNDRPSLDCARRTSFRPRTSEEDLAYFDWIATNRRRVEQASGGRVGYLHLPNMGADGIREFIKWFYGQVRKEGLVIDVRSNGGGNVSQMIIERLRRMLLGTRFARNNETPGTYPSTTFYGHMACILDEDSASDGDIFPHMFRQAGLGPLIGKRSWGGVVGITNHGNLIDGGTVFVPEFGTNAIDGSWIIEGHGVDPDIVVENDPKSILEGRDPQLERAISEVLERIRLEPRRLPDRPAPPIKTN